MIHLTFVMQLGIHEGYLEQGQHFGATNKDIS